MISPEITKTGPFKFEVRYPEHPALKLDFEPLHEEAQRLHPCNQYVMKHWQARPGGLRRFGLFAWWRGDGLYTCHAEPKSSSATHYDLQIKESDLIPSAVLYYPQAVQLDSKVLHRIGSTPNWTKPEKSVA